MIETLFQIFNGNDPTDIRTRTKMEAKKEIRKAVKESRTNVFFEPQKIADFKIKRLK